MRDTVVSVWRAPYLLLAIVVVAGCGGSGGDGRLTKKSYAARADAICTKYRKQTGALPNPTNIAQLVNVVDKSLPILDSALKDLRALTPPADERAAADQWLAQFGKLTNDLRQIRDKAATQDLQGVAAVARRAQLDNAKSNELGTRLGFKVCNQD